MWSKETGQDNCRCQSGKNLISSLLSILFVGKLLAKKRSRGLLKYTCCGEEWFHPSPLIQTGRRGKRCLSDGGGLIPSAEAEAASLRLYFFITTKTQKQLGNQQGTHTPKLKQSKQILFYRLILFSVQVVILSFFLKQVGKDTFHLCSQMDKREVIILNYSSRVFLFQPREADNSRGWFIL